MELRRVRCLTSIIFLLCIFATSISIYASTTEEARELDRQCKEARAKKLKPIQESKIKHCVNVQGKSLDYCQRYYATYGWGGKSGYAHRKGLFEDLPVCIAAFEAWKNRER